MSISSRLSKNLDSDAFGNSIFLHYCIIMISMYSRVEEAIFFWEVNVQNNLESKKNQ